MSDNLPPLPISLEQFTELAHRTASRYSHRSEPSKVAYTFLPHTLDDFHRQVCAAIEADRVSRDVPAGWFSLPILQHSYMTEILDRALRNIERGWSRCASARDEKGLPCSPNCTNAARSWSLLGALDEAVACLMQRVTKGMTFGEHEAAEGPIYAAAEQVRILVAGATGLKNGYSIRRIDEWNDDKERQKHDVEALLSKVLNALAAAPQPQPVAQPVQASECEWTNCPRRVGDVCCNQQKE